MTLLHAAWTPLRLRRVQVAFLAALLALWVLRAVTIYRDPVLGGIFRWIGVDFGTYYIQASAFAAGRLEALYSLAALEPFRHALAAYASDPATPLLPGLTPYPALFAWLLSPLTSLTPPLAFALWTASNVVLAFGLAWRVATFFPVQQRVQVALLTLVSVPLAYTIWLGQVQLLLALAFGEAFLALRSGRDLRAGVWLAALIVKPQYLILLGPVLVWKRRWRTLAGFAAGITLILGASALVAGPSSLAAYVGSMLESAGMSSGGILPDVAPEVMVNWRALVLAVPGGLASGVNLTLTLLLTGLTVIAILPAWLGPWRPTSPRFAGQMTLLLLATILATYHSHAYGVLLLAVPLAADLSSRTPTGARERALEAGTWLAVGAGIIAPAIWFVLGRSAVHVANMLALALVACTVLFLGLLLPGGPLASGGSEAEEERSPVHPAIADEPASAAAWSTRPSDRAPVGRPVRQG